MTSSRFKDPEVLTCASWIIYWVRMWPGSEEVHRTKNWSPTSWKTSLVRCGRRLCSCTVSTSFMQVCNCVWNFKLQALLTLFVSWFLRYQRRQYRLPHLQTKKSNEYSPPIHPKSWANLTSMGRSIPYSPHSPSLTDGHGDTRHHLAELMTFALIDLGQGPFPFFPLIITFSISANNISLNGLGNN